MSDLSRRKLITAGIATAAGASGLVAAADLAKHFGLVPPDAGGLYGAGETLTYAAQRVLTKHSMAREFPASEISNPPFTNEVAPFSEAYKRLQAGGFADWRLTVDGLVARPCVDRGLPWLDISIWKQQMTVSLDTPCRPTTTI